MLVGRVVCRLPDLVCRVVMVRVAAGSGPLTSSRSSGVVVIHWPVVRALLVQVIGAVVLNPLAGAVVDSGRAGCHNSGVVVIRKFFGCAVGPPEANLRGYHVQFATRLTLFCLPRHAGVGGRVGACWWVLPGCPGGARVIGCMDHSSIGKFSPVVLLPSSVAGVGGSAAAVGGRTGGIRKLRAFDRPNRTKPAQEKTQNKQVRVQGTFRRLTA